MRIEIRFPEHEGRERQTSVIMYKHLASFIGE
jgi:hypothetical protein